MKQDRQIPQNLPHHWDDVADENEDGDEGEDEDEDEAVAFEEP